MRVPASIRSERLLLRRHHMGDLDAFAEFLAHPTATRYMAFTAEQKTLAGARQMLEYVIRSYDTEHPVVSFTIADPASDAYRGSCGLSVLGESADTVEIYYTILPGFENQGWATDATAALLEHYAKAAGIRCFVAHIVPENIASRRVAEKLGFRDAGPVEREASTGELAHQALGGRRYLLERLTPGVPVGQ